MATAVLIIDVQRTLVEALEPARRAALISTLEELLARARAGGFPVVYVRHDGGETELTPGTAGWEIAPEIAPNATEPVVDKRFCDAFRDTNLAGVLEGLEADHVVIAGMQTEYCIDSTVREAERRGFEVTLVADGHATYAAAGLTEDQIRAHVHRVAAGIARIVPAAGVFARSPA
jgi:nicotinamidase-related amidase